MATKRFKLLDLFSGAGGAARGYQLAGFHVTGVDVEPQPRYAGDEFHQADALTYPLDGFDAIHASPPCQLYSAANNIRQRDDHPGLIPAIRRRLKAAGVPYVIENVPRSPLDNYIVICGLAFPELNVKRHRWFESNVAMIVPPCGDHTRDYLIVFGGSPRRRAKQIGRTAKSGPILYRGFATADEGRAAMGIDWMNRDELSQAIPPAYTTFIGELLLAHLSAQIPRAAATPDASQRVTAGTSPFDGRAPDGPGPAAALGPLFEAEVAEPATAASPPDSGIASAATRRARPASASNLPRPVCGWSWPATTSSSGCSTLDGGSPSSTSPAVRCERARLPARPCQPRPCSRPHPRREADRRAGPPHRRAVRRRVGAGDRSVPEHLAVLAGRPAPARGRAVAGRHQRRPAPQRTAKQGTVGLMPDWSWWDAWRSGDPDASRDALDAETDRSLERDPGRWSWKSSSEAIDEERRRSGWGSHSAGQRHRTGKGHVEKGESGERTQWRDHEWRTAREDYERQNPDRNERDDDRGIFW